MDELKLCPICGSNLKPCQEINKFRCFECEKCGTLVSDAFGTEIKEAIEMLITASPWNGKMMCCRNCEIFNDLSRACRSRTTVKKKHLEDVYYCSKYEEAKESEKK